MRKLILAALIAFIVAHPLTALSQSSLGLKGKSSYTNFVDGLKQFPAKYTTPRGYVRAVVYGTGVGNPVTENGTVLDSQVLTLATEDGQDLIIQVVGPKLELALLMHEMVPFTGRYKFWQPVLEFKGKHNDWVYSWYEIELIGRFYMETNKDSEVIGYQNEIYR